jgi:hypothetical protein
MISYVKFEYLGYIWLNLEILKLKSFTEIILG